MDYLDPQKQYRHRIVLLVGYVFVAIAIVFATLILLYQAYGFGLGDNGSVIQNGLAFVSSQPVSAQIYVNGNRKAQTSARLLLQAGNYEIKLSQTGYRDWSRLVNVSGGSVVHFNYPILFPSKLKTTKLQTSARLPNLTTQSPDRRWMIAQSLSSELAYDVYDLKNPTQPATQITLPSAVVSKSSSTESWQTTEWADDNQHFVLLHNYDGKSEYILVDRQSAGAAQNLNTTLSVTPTRLSLRNHKYDQYYVFDAGSKSLSTSSLSSTAQVPIIDGASDYETYGNDSVLYVTTSNAPTGKVLLELYSGGQSYIIHSFTVDSKYLLALNNYAGVLYLAAGAVSDNKVYVYKDPISQLQAQPKHSVVPIQVLHVSKPNYLSFSTTGQFVVAEQANQFGVFDIENRNGYTYKLSAELDPPQLHSTWMDNNHLTYTSNGKTIVFDYDGVNLQYLVANSPANSAFFAPDYKSVLNFNDKTSSGITALGQTSLIATP